MALIASSSSTGTDFKPIPQGNWPGRCYRIIDLGTQTSEWKGKTKTARKVMLAWELYGDDDEPLVTDDGNPLTIAKRYTLSLSEKAALRFDLESWRGKAFTEEELDGFDLKKLLGATAMLNVTHDTRDGKTYANVSSLAAVPKAMRASIPEAVNEVQFFDVTEPEQAVFEALSERLQETIRACAEWAKPAPAQARAPAHTQAPQSIADMEDDIPY